MPGCVAPPPALQPLQQLQADPSQAAGVTGPSAAPAQASRPNHQAAKPALQPAKSQGGIKKRDSPATRLHTTRSGVSKPTSRARKAGTTGSGVSKPTRRQTAVAPRRGAASRGGRAAGSIWRGQTGALSMLAALSHASCAEQAALPNAAALTRCQGSGGCASVCCPTCNRRVQGLQIFDTAPCLALVVLEAGCCLLEPVHSAHISVQLCIC